MDESNLRRRRVSTLLFFSIALITCIAATLLNPYGMGVYTYAADLSRLGLERGIEEWLPPGPELWVSRVFYVSLLLLVGAMTFSRRRLSALDVCLIACFLPPALIAVRMVPWWMLAVTPTIVRLAAGIWSEAPIRVRRPSRAAGAALAALAGVAVISLPWLDSINPVMGTLRPTRRAEADVRRMVEERLADRPRRVFTRFESGNYLCWAIGARRQVFMEGHVELYPDELWNEYLAVTTGGARWDRVLDRYGVDTLLLDTAYHTDLIRRVRASAHWAEAARSGNALVFERRTPEAIVDLRREIQRDATDGRRP